MRSLTLSTPLLSQLHPIMQLPLSLSLLLSGTASLLLLGGAPSGVSAHTKSCRYCECDYSVSGYVRASDYGNFESKFLSKITGGDSVAWDKNRNPTAKNNWSGHGKFWRLCGNGGGKVNHDWLFPYWGQETWVKLGCECHQSVRCHDGSDCANSEL